MFRCQGLSLTPVAGELLYIRTQRTKNNGSSSGNTVTPITGAKEMAAEETIISWNFANWATVIIMAAVGFAILGFGIKVYQKRKAGE